YVGEGTDLDSDGLSILADAPTMKADAGAFAVGISLLGGGLGLVSNAEVSGVVEAFIGAQATRTSSASAPQLQVRGPVVIDADALGCAIATGDGVNASLGLALSVTLPSAMVTGATRAYVRDGVSMFARTLTIHAGTPADRVRYEAKATSFMAGIAF